MRLLIFVFIFTMAIDNVLPFILKPFYKGYSHKTMALSVLGCRQSPVKWIYNIWCIISGIVFCVAGYIFFDAFNNGLSISIWILLAIYGIGCEFISGLFPVNENYNDKDVITNIHGIGSVLGFSLLIFVPLLLSINCFSFSNVVVATISIICFAISILFFAFFIMGEKKKFKHTILIFGGLWQRLVLLFSYLPLFVFACTML